MTAISGTLKPMADGGRKQEEQSRREIKEPDLAPAYAHDLAGLAVEHGVAIGLRAGLGGRLLQAGWCDRSHRATVQ